MNKLKKLLNKFTEALNTKLSIWNFKPTLDPAKRARTAKIQRAQARENKKTTKANRNKQSYQYVQNERNLQLEKAKETQTEADVRKYAELELDALKRKQHILEAGNADLDSLNRLDDRIQKVENAIDLMNAGHYDKALSKLNISNQSETHTEGIRSYILNEKQEALQQFMEKNNIKNTKTAIDKILQKIFESRPKPADIPGFENIIAGKGSDWRHCAYLVGTGEYEVYSYVD